MTVKQLIEALQALPQDLPVYLGGFESDIPIDHVEAGHDDRGPQLLPRVAEACERPRKWNHPRRVVIG
jgi:hypothetical protein